MVFTKFGKRIIKNLYETSIDQFEKGEYILAAINIKKALFWRPKNKAFLKLQKQIKKKIEASK